jgi:hypothetical protein
MWPEARICEDFDNCSQRYSKKPSRRAHQLGVVDNWNVIHWSGLDTRVVPVSLYRACFLVVLATDQDLRKVPEPYKLWRAHTWAHKKFREDWHKRSKIAWSVDDRVRSWKKAEKMGLRVEDTGDMFYLWCFRGREYALAAGNMGARSANRYRVPEWMKEEWVKDRAAGLSFSEIGKKYDRDFRSVWKVMVRSGLHNKNVG